MPDMEYYENLAGPFLALDVGEARVGGAVSDPGGLIARPRATVSRIPRKECLDRLETLLRETGATAAVLGLPLLESGAEGGQAARARAFARSLARRIPGLRITFSDERYTTAGAREHIRGAGRGAARRRDAAGRSSRDDLAAALLLQEWLDERARRRQRDAPRS